MGFKASDYKHLDKATLKDFVAEFLLRNKAFLKDYSKLNDLSYTDLDIRLQDMYFGYGVEFILKDRYAEKPNRANLDFALPPAVRAVRLLPRDAKEQEEELENRRQAYLENNDLSSTRWCSYTTSEFNLFHDREYGFGDKTDLLEALLDIEEPGVFTHPDTLLLSVRLDATKERILEEFDRVLSIHKGRRGSSLRLEQWKYYLIVYDLVDQGMGYREIADNLSRAYPDNPNLLDERNIENYRKAAEKLIKGGYKRYL